LKVIEILSSSTTNWKDSTKKSVAQTSVFGLFSR